MNATQAFMDATDWVERYAWFGAMEHLQGVNAVRERSRCVILPAIADSYPRMMPLWTLLAESMRLESNTLEHVCPTLALTSHPALWTGDLAARRTRRWNLQLSPFGILIGWSLRFLWRVSR